MVGMLNEENKVRLIARLCIICKLWIPFWWMICIDWSLASTTKCFVYRYLMAWRFITNTNTLLLCIFCLWSLLVRTYLAPFGLVFQDKILDCFSSEVKIIWFEFSQAPHRVNKSKTIKVYSNSFGGSEFIQTCLQAPHYVVRKLDVSHKKERISQTHSGARICGLVLLMS